MLVDSNSIKKRGKETIKLLPDSIEIKFLAKKEYFDESIMEQKKDRKNKIYSIHESEVSCIAKGKEHKKYEFGSKVSILITK